MDSTSSPPPSPPLSLFDKQAMLQKALRGELTPADTKAYIESIRLSFTADAAKKPRNTAPRLAKPVAPETSGPLDFF